MAIPTVEPSGDLVPIPSLPQHIGVVVRDIDKTLEYFSSTFAVGQTDIMGEYIGPKEELLAGTTDVQLKVATVELGSIKLELLQPLDPDDESTWSQFLRDKGEGVHHIAWYRPNIDEEMSKFEAQGIEMLVGGYLDGKRWTYWDTGSKPGGIVTEFLEFEVGPPAPAIPPR